MRTIPLAQSNRSLLCLDLRLDLRHFHGTDVTIRAAVWRNLSEIVFSHLVYCCMSSLLVDLFTCLLDPTTSDLHPVITLATIVHSFHIRERHV